MADTLEPKHRVMAAMVATGAKDAEVAEEMGVSVTTFRAVKKKPLFAALVEHLTKDLVDRSIQTAADKIHADGSKNVDFLTTIRDGGFDEDEEAKTRLRLQASGMLLDRQVPKRTEQTSTSTHIFKVEAYQRKMIEEVCEEAGHPITVEAEIIEESDDVLLPAPPKPVIRDLDDVMHDAELAEGARLEADLV